MHQGFTKAVHKKLSLPTIISIIITVTAIAAIIFRIMMPAMMFDSVTLWLIAIAILPWLAPVVKSIEWGGAKIEFHDRLKHLENETKKMHEEMDDLVLKVERLRPSRPVRLPQNSAAPYVFVHIATAKNTQNNFTIIDNFAINNNPKALLFVTQNWNPKDHQSGTYNPEPVGVWFTKEGKWSIFNQDRHSKMPVGAAFNVMVLYE